MVKPTRTEIRRDEPCLREGYSEDSEPNEEMISTRYPYIIFDAVTLLCNRSKDLECILILLKGLQD